MIPNQNQNIRQNPRNFNVRQLSNNNNFVNTQIRNPQRSPLAVNTNRFNVHSLSQFNSPRISRDQMINPNSILYSPALNSGFIQNQQQLSVDFNQQLSFNPNQGQVMQTQGYNIQHGQIYSQLPNQSYQQVVIRHYFHSFC